MGDAMVLTATKEPKRGLAGALFAEALWAYCEEIADEYDFDLAWEDDGDTRTLMLLGPDSPAEMTLVIRKPRLDDSTLEALGNHVVRWMDDKGIEWTGRDAGVVPKGQD